MLSAVTREAVGRLASARSLLRVVKSLEVSPVGKGDDSRSAKGLLFVQNYAIYEYVVVESVRGLVQGLNSRSLAFATTRTELLAMALDPEFMSIIDGKPPKTWARRAELLRKVRSTTPVAINDGLFPKDGTHFRPPQLETIWSIFGLPGDIVPQARLRGHITEMVETRNRIAHGREAPHLVGGRFSVGDLEKRINDTEAVCTHIIATATSYAAQANAFL
jgi:hypothetical protein